MDIGFVGLGAMGAGIVPKLMAAGHAVTGWNRSKDKAEPLIKAGMRFAATPRMAAAAADIVFSIVTDAAAVTSVALGADGIIVEVAEDPEAALCDGPQQLYASDFDAFARDVLAHAELAGSVGK